MGHLGDMQQTSYRITAFLGPGGAKKTCPPGLIPVYAPVHLQWKCPPPPHTSTKLFYTTLILTCRSSFHQSRIHSYCFQTPSQLFPGLSGIHTTLEYKIQASIQPQNIKFKHPYNLRIQNLSIHTNSNTKFKHS